MAVKRDVTLHPGQKVAELGYAFVAALNFKTYTYTWCRNNPAQGEAGKALVFVRLDRACLAAKGKALGTGYVADAGDSGPTTAAASGCACARRASAWPPRGSWPCGA